MQPTFNYKNATNFWFLLYRTELYFGLFHGFIVGLSQTIIFQTINLAITFSISQLI